MRPPLSSPSCIFFCSTPPCAPRTPVVQRGSRAMPRSLWSPEFMPPKRTFVPGQVSPPGADSNSVLLARETTHCRASGLAASRVGASRPRTQGRACDACDRLLYVSAHVSPQLGSRPKHHNLYSPTGDPPKPGTGTTLLSRGGLSAHPSLFRSPGPVLGATLPSSPLFRYSVLLWPCATLVRLGKRSRLCRRATGEEYPGRWRTKGAGCRGQPPPAPSCSTGRPRRPAPRYAAGFRALELVSLDCQSTSLAP